MATATTTRANPALLASAARRSSVAVLGWAGLVLAGHLIAQHLLDADYRVHIGAPPLVGGFDVRASWRLVGAVALAGLAVAYAPAVAQRLAWRRLLALAWLGALAWAVLLAVGDGWGALTHPLLSRYEYLGAVGQVGSPGTFLGHFTERLSSYPTHVKGHPPGFLLALRGLSKGGLGGAGPAAALVIAGGALCAPAALIAVRATSGERSARAVAPYVTFAPAAVWMATSADALFAGVSATGIALVAVALHGAPRSRALWAVGAGVVLGGALLLSYGVAPIAIVVLALVVTAPRERALRVVAVAAGGVAVVVVAFGLAGFWWWDGLHATHQLYSAGAASRRPYAAFLAVSLAAFALACGPAALAGAVSRSRDGVAMPAALIGGIALTVAAADLSGLSRGETERIWLLFVPWALCATAALRGRGWLAAQLALGLTLQATVLSPW